MALRIVCAIGMLVLSGMALSCMTLGGGAEAAACRDDTIQGLIRPEQNTVPAYEIITRYRIYYKVLGPDAEKAASWRETDAITLCPGAKQSGLFKITNKRLNIRLDAELAPPPATLLMGAGQAR